MVRPNIPAMIHAGGARDAQEARVLAGAIVMQRRGRAARPRQRPARVLVARPMRPTFECASVQPCTLQHALRDLNMRRLAAMTGAGEREFLVAEAITIRRTAFDQWQRLQRLNRRARIDKAAPRRRASAPPRHRHLRPPQHRDGGFRSAPRAPPRPEPDYPFVMFSKCLK